MTRPFIFTVHDREEGWTVPILLLAVVAFLTIILPGATWLIGGR